MVVGEDGGNAGLLAHEFRDGDGVGLGEGTPRERALVFLVPAVEKGKGELDFRIEEWARGPRVQRHG